MPTTFRQLRRETHLLLGGALVGLVLAAALLGVFYTPYDPFRLGPARLQGPSPAHPFGTDQFGRDVLSRILAGADNTLIVGVISVGIGLSLGVLVGALAGSLGRGPDEVLMRLMDVIYGFPAILLAILITAILRPGIQNSMIAIGIANVPVFARLTRGSFLSLREQDFVTAARALGRSRAGIVLRHLLPNSLSPLLVQATSSFAVAILAEAALSYLGLGTQPPEPSWGWMLREAQTLINRTVWPAVFPGAAIALAVLGFNLLGDGLRDVLDPRTARRR